MNVHSFSAGKGMVSAPVVHIAREKIRFLIRFFLMTH